MIFQTFDEKKECFLIYKESRFHDHLSKDCTHTWSYAPYLQDGEIEYANLFIGRGSLEEGCPEALKEKHQDVQSQIKALLRATATAGLDMNKICIYEILPKHVLVKWAEVKNSICNYIFQNNRKPTNYDHLLKITKVIADIKYRNLNLDLNKIIRLNVQDKNTYKLLKYSNPYIVYDQFKTITGRLSTKKRSFPVMTLAKKYREVVKPNNDWLFELDFNAAELRTVLGLLNYKQPSADLHEWNLQHIFKGIKDRETAKKRVFAWLYNPRSEDGGINAIYDREKLKTLHFRDNKIINPFGREIECDEDHAISYLVQSTAADLLFEQMYKVWEFLKGKKSFIKFCNHDAIMIDLAEEDQYCVNNIKEIFCETRLGRFKINCSGGKDWLNMQRLNIT